MDKDNKIEDRKRPSGASDDGAPPRKKMAVNGGVAKDEHDNQAEEVWIEVSLRASRDDFCRGDFTHRHVDLFPIPRSESVTACSLVPPSTRLVEIRKQGRTTRQFRQRFPPLRHSRSSALLRALAIITACRVSNC